MAYNLALQGFTGIRLAFIPTVVLVLLGVSACSGTQINPSETETFAATGYTHYAWRSESPKNTPNSKDMLAQKSPSIRAGVEAEMLELGYRQVNKADAEFLIEYVAAPGFNDGQLLRGGSNDTLYGSSVNRQIDGASEDNAYALSGPVKTGEMKLLFIDAQSSSILWRVDMSIVVEDANRIDHDEVRKTVRQGIATLPPAPQ
ncbi:DUF4136 domain-containing protein [Congregibacter brevis]|uniref:DUF4136 domain-containing protein n=1 Tax=Congregibacter brevis TaxID=3081201 RepID=A0ABZ0IFB0_9GAMM|nr:DUF4136 domain-containing protein [Congregibacter sp. IMCC45268]